MKGRDTGVQLLDRCWGLGSWQEGGGPIGHGLLLRARQAVIVDTATSGCQVRLTVAARRGRLVAEEITVRSMRDGDGVTGTDLRAVPVASLLRDTLRLLVADPFRVMKPGDPLQLVAPTRDEVTAIAKTARRRPGADPATAAELYCQALADPRNRWRPTAHVAQQLHLSRSHTSRLIAKAREVGLLDPARPGRAGERPATTSENERNQS